jgi:signal transduction histidine kinase
MQTEVSVKGDSSLVSQEVCEQLFLTLREGVRNAVSHSGAGRITVAVEFTPEKISGSVEDDGHGFDPREVVPHTSGGLKSMKERMTLIGGSLRLDSTPGGTRIEVDIPLSQRG